MSLSSRNTVDNGQCSVRQMKCRNNNKKRLDCLLGTITMRSRLCSERAASRFNFSKTGFYHCCRISLILLHTFAMCLITLSISTSLESWKAYCISICLITVIVLHHHTTLLWQMPHEWLSHYLKFTHSMNPTFSLDFDPATSVWGTRTRARTNEWDNTAEHALRHLVINLSIQLTNQGS
jgi:hypothetical protein